ncbi:chromosome condensation regulator RCC1 repeat protein [Leptospira interrogans str. L0996]|nr:chromosome condensation regulator RCC1 repeat protein [Leptospira interrogans str. L0996]
MNIQDVASIWAGGTQSFAILKNGEVKGWGANGNMASLALGESNTQKVYEPNKAVVGIDNVVHFGCGATHNFALLGNGEIYGWGNFKGFRENRSTKQLGGTKSSIHKISIIL